MNSVFIFVFQLSHFRPGCSLPEIWDLEDQENQDKEPACIKIQKNPRPHFKQAFENSVYQVLKLT